MCPSSGNDDCVMLWSHVGMCCNNTWCYTDMSHCECVVCGCEGFLVVVSLLYVGIVRFVIRLKYIPVAAATGMYYIKIIKIKITLKL